MTAAERKRKSRMKVAGMTDEERKEYKKKGNERLNERLSQNIILRLR